MKRNYKIATILSVAFIMVSTLFILNQKATNHNELIEKVSMVDSEYEIEKKFKVNGYTLDNPNIILNPYGNSPLTALVLFETEQELDVKVTITGKDKLTTYILFLKPKSTIYQFMVYMQILTTRLSLSVVIIKKKFTFKQKNFQKI